MNFYYPITRQIKKLKKILSLILTLIMFSCTGIPTPVYAYAPPPIPPNNNREACYIRVASTYTIDKSLIATVYIEDTGRMYIYQTAKYVLAEIKFLSTADA